MHVYFYNYEYWEGDREMVDSGVVKGENAIVAYTGAEKCYQGGNWRSGIYNLCI